MLTVYRRHTNTCEHRAEGRKYRRCKCPLWVDGFLENRDIRQSLKMRDWQQAQVRVRDAEAAIEKHAVGCAIIAGILSGVAKRCTCGADDASANSEPITVEQAWKQFIADAEARGLRPPTLYKFQLLSRVMLAFAQTHGLRYLREFDLERTRAFRESWKLQNLSSLRRLGNLRTFFRFAQEGNWIVDNPARKLKPPRIVPRPTLPFSQQQVGAILAACDFAETRGLKALALLLRYSGLRIGDAVTLSCQRIVDGKLRLYTAKTGTHVYCPLPAFVITALEAVKRPNGFFFWTGESTAASVTGNWRRRLAAVAALAKVENAHPHRFRDTFAIELLLAGVPLERVSILLGHQSVRITEKHYAPWMRDRQAQLEADVRRTWSEDSLAQSETKGTSEVHGTGGRPISADIIGGAGENRTHV